jgi:hypothetical protein
MTDEIKTSSIDNTSSIVLYDEDNRGGVSLPGSAGDIGGPNIRIKVNFRY